MKNVLITGITGFIGRNLIPYLGNGKNLRLFGLTSQPEKAASLYKRDDLQEIYTYDNLDISGEFDVMVHLAGKAHDVERKSDSEDYFKVNFELPKQIFAAAKKSGVGKFIFLSSIKAVTDHEEGIIDEGVMPVPSSPYGVSKRLAEDHILNQENHSGLDCYILRPCMVHGPGNKGNLKLLYTFIEKGWPYPLGSFDNQRSLLSVDNLNFIILSILEQKISPGIYHLSDDGFISTREIVKIIGEVRQRNVRIWHTPQYLIKSIARLGRITGAFFNEKTLDKLVSNYRVSNEKLKRALSEPLPVTLRAGLRRTFEAMSK